MSIQKLLFVFAILSLFLMGGCENESGSSDADATSNSSGEVTSPGGLFGDSSNSSSNNSSTTTTPEGVFGAGTSGGEAVGAEGAERCEVACTKLVGCFSDLSDEPLDAAECITGCQEEATTEELGCVESNQCDAILSECFGLSAEDLQGGSGTGSTGEPATPESCTQACSTLISCFDFPQEEANACVNDCTAEATADEIGCVNSNSCDSILMECFGVSEDDITDPGPQNNTTPDNNGFEVDPNAGVSGNECVQLCDKVAECGQTLTDEECQFSCAFATSEIVSCIVSRSCSELEAGVCNTSDTP